MPPLLRLNTAASLSSAEDDTTTAAPLSYRNVAGRRSRSDPIFVRSSARRCNGSFRKRNVTFAETVVVHIIADASSQQQQQQGSSSQSGGLWYTAMELESIRQRDHTIKQLARACILYESDDHSLRGLENGLMLRSSGSNNSSSSDSDSCHYDLRSCRRDALHAVIFEQEKQKVAYGGVVVDTGAIANAYRKYSRRAMQRARSLAQQDERDVLDDHYRSIHQLRAPWAVCHTNSNPVLGVNSLILNDSSLVRCEQDDDDDGLLEGQPGHSSSSSQAPTKANGVDYVFELFETWLTCF